MKKSLETVSLDAMIDKHIGKLGTKRRDNFENKIKLDSVAFLLL
jgi:HTH-type transcriptional regulator / antitoxin HipB